MKNSRMLNKQAMIGLAVVYLCTDTLAGPEGPSAHQNENLTSTAATTISTEDQAALDLGHKVLAVRKAIENPMAPDAMHAVTSLGHDQRYYVMVRGWLSYQLRGDISILDANREQTSDQVKQRIRFLKEAIRALDLE